MTPVSGESALGLDGLGRAARLHHADGAGHPGAVVRAVPVWVLALGQVLLVVAIPSGAAPTWSLVQLALSPASAPLVGALVDKAAKRNIIHKNAANRRKSRLAKRLNAAQAQGA